MARQIASRHKRTEIQYKSGNYTELSIPHQKHLQPQVRALAITTGSTAGSIFAKKEQSRPHKESTNLQVSQWSRSEIKTIQQMQAVAGQRIPISLSWQRWTPLESLTLPDSARKLPQKHGSCEIGREAKARQPLLQYKWAGQSR